MGRLDPATGTVTEYPMPYTDNGMRDFFHQQQRDRSTRLRSLGVANIRICRIQAVSHATVDVHA
jgi:streptogramin lyase